MSIQSRLSADELRALSPGDVVGVESGREFGRRRNSVATVVRVDAFHVTVSCPGPRGSRFVERYRLLDGLQAGGGTFARLVRAAPVGSRAGERARQAARIQELFRAWNRNRDDVALLHQLQAAIGDLLEQSLV
jgi:hypothetical protein